MAKHKDGKSSDEGQYDPEAPSRRTDQGDIEQVDSAGMGLPVEDEDPPVSKREGKSGVDVGRLTRPR